MGEVVPYQAFVEIRRRRVARALHLRCRALLAGSVAAARADLAQAPVAEWAVRSARLRKLEELEAYAAAVG